MNLFDPLRPRSPDGKPCWQALPHVVVPELIFHPQGEELLSVRMMVPSLEHPGAFHWVERTVGTPAMLVNILKFWIDDPEQTLETYFGHPRPARWAVQAGQPREAEARVESSAEELGL